jgi:hypothetical protein
VPQQYGDSIDQALQSYDTSTQNVNRGERVKFDHETGNYVTQSGEELDPEQSFLVTGVAQVWAMFKEDPETGAKVPVFRGVDANGVLPERHELGEGYSIEPNGSIKVDKSGWKKFMGQLQDPWTLFFLVYFYDEATCQEYTLQLKSGGGRTAWYALLGQIKDRRRKFPGALRTCAMRKSSPSKVIMQLS